MTVPISKRYSTWVNIIVIVSAAVMPFIPDLIPHEYQSHVLMGLALVTGLAQGIKQGKFDDQQS